MNLTRLFVVPLFLFAAAGSVVSCGSVVHRGRSVRRARIRRGAQVVVSSGSR